MVKFVFNNIFKLIFRHGLNLTRKLVYLIFSIILFTNCNHRIVRINYNKTSTENKHCDVPITNNLSLIDSSSQYIGSIKLKDSGFSSYFIEYETVRILKSEAYIVDANIVIIREEHRPDRKSTCYRCVADFYKTKNKNIKNIDNNYHLNNIQERVLKDKEVNKQNLIYILTFSIGMALTMSLL